MSGPSAPLKSVIHWFPGISLNCVFKLLEPLVLWHRSLHWLLSWIMLCSLLRDFCSLNKVHGLASVGTDSLGHSNDWLSNWSRRPLIPCNAALNLDSWHFGHVVREKSFGCKYGNRSINKAPWGIVSSWINYGSSEWSLGKGWSELNEAAPRIWIRCLPELQTSPMSCWSHCHLEMGSRWEMKIRKMWKEFLHKALVA